VSELPVGLVRRSDGSVACGWPGDDADYQRYHDVEWGEPTAEDVLLFEKVCLEGFQAGLSWLTILRKRENFRAAFAGFDLAAVAGFDDSDRVRLMNDAGIVRNRAKIEATINNAQRAIELVEQDGSLAAYFWRFEPEASARPKLVDHEALMNLSQTPASKALSTDLKARGWRFVGPTTMYALMQAMGLVNDHLAGCATRPAVDAAREAFIRPG